MPRRADFPWADFFRRVRRMIADAPVPYVTRLSLALANRPDKRPFAVLAATIVSLRTQDKTTEAASEKLLTLADSPEKLARAGEDEIARAIYPCGFYRTKAGQLKRIAQTLLDRHGGGVPGDLDELVKLPGVGRKTANLVLTEGFDADGICVDTHVHRIANRIGAVRTRIPDETESALRKILPRRYWKKINLWLVTFGQNLCRPVGPKCASCSWMKNCPSARSGA